MYDTKMEFYLITFRYAEQSRNCSRAWLCLALIPEHEILRQGRITVNVVSSVWTM